jgi:hypothetical protein
MYVEAMLKAPEQEPWVALTRVDSDGSTRSLGYLPPETLRLAALAVKTVLELGEEAGVLDAMLRIGTPMTHVEAWRDFVDWADRVAELRDPAEPPRLGATVKVPRPVGEDARGFRRTL